uniref:C-type lectin domain-containing protein n=1 Tax=Esox lucius TaxID=8010 RepID=A0A6Q2X0T3_ESOLU
MLKMFLLLSGAFSLGDVCFMTPECNQGWHQFGSCCFRFEETQPRCQSLGGHLTSVHSWEESRFLETLTVGSPLTWIGGNDGGQPELTKIPLHTRFIRMTTVRNTPQGQSCSKIFKDRSWSWTDGSGFNYPEWAQGDPNNYNGVREPCIQMNFGDERRWNDDV